MLKALTIAGSDSSGGAGIQADIKTMAAHGIYGMSAITALTAQNTTGVTSIAEVTPDFLCAQLDAVFQDIFPDAVKIGMLPETGLMRAVAEKLLSYRAEHIVLDPVMVSTSGARLMKEEAASFMREELFPLAELITPNIPETEALTGREIRTAGEMEQAAQLLHRQIMENKKGKIALGEFAERDTAVLVKGGHSVQDANDVLVFGDRTVWIRGERIDNPNTHGTGCTLSSAIACGLAKGMDLEEAVRSAKDYLTGALRSGLDLGRGSGPLNHLWAL